MKRLEFLAFLQIKVVALEVSYYRCINPLNKLQELYPHRVEIRLDENPLGRLADNSGWEPNWTFENLKWADVVLVSNISNFGGPATARVVGKAREFGKFVHFDTDDLLTGLYEEHRLYETYKNLQLDEITKFIYSNSDLVTVTQNKFADRIKPYCSKFLAVIKNAIDYNLPGWNQPKKSSKRSRMGWMAGIHHLGDLKKFIGIPHLVNQKCGVENVKWNLYGHPPPNKDGSKDWQWDTWRQYVGDFMRGMKGNKNWEVFMALPPNDYGVYYSDLDISIAPLQVNDFNDSKSDIKVAECGRYKIPLIATNVGCYNETIENGKTGYLIDPDTPNTEWVRILSKLVKDRKLCDELGRNLNIVTNQTFDLNKVCHHRINMYEECFKTMGWDPRQNRNKEGNLQR